MKPEQMMQYASEAQSRSKKRWSQNDEYIERAEELLEALELPGKNDPTLLRISDWNRYFWQHHLDPRTSTSDDRLTLFGGG